MPARQDGFGQGEQVSLACQFLLGEQALFFGFGLVLYVYAPACELGRQAGVLPRLAYGEGELVIRHDDDGGFVSVGAPQYHFGDFGRAQGIGHEDGGVLVPFDHVYLLTV